MNRELAKKIADTVLYEGYMLYPYRRSAIKNQQRWSFGIIYPPAFEEVQSGTERSVMHSECLLEIKAEARIDVELRFLQLVEVAALSGTTSDTTPPGENSEEGIERSFAFSMSLPGDWYSEPFSFPANCKTEPLIDGERSVVGSRKRTQRELSGSVTLSPKRISDRVLKLTIEVINETRSPSNSLDRASALQRSLLSAHTILSVTGARFVSLLDPPENLREAVSQCRNVGNFPVMLGEEGERDVMLCSPIVLYDYPQIAPESAGDFYDSTEMDEMLTLRVMTLSDEEKAEVRGSDDRVRDLLQRTEKTAREQLMRTHGTIRGLRPSTPPRGKSA